MAKWNTNPAVANLIAQIKQKAADCRIRLAEIEAKADYWGNTDPDPSQVNKDPATVMGWMTNAKNWLATEYLGTGNPGVASLFEAREEIDHGGGGGQMGKPGGKGGKPKNTPN